MLVGSCHHHHLCRRRRRRLDLVLTLCLLPFGAVAAEDETKRRKRAVRLIEMTTLLDSLAC